MSAEHDHGGFRLLDFANGDLHDYVLLKLFLADANEHGTGSRSS